MFVYRIRIPECPFTQRGVLGVVNTIYDVFSCDAPVFFGGWLLQCKAFPTKDAINAGKARKLGWDDPLPPEYLTEWNWWKASLDQLHLIEILCPYAPKGLGSIIFSCMSVFCDASQDAIGHVMYLHSVNVCGEISVTFIMGESKLPPKEATTIPRMELCATVNAVQSAIANISEMVKKKPYKIKFYSDSKLVLGYINNEERRFARYVGNRINVIRKLSKPTDC